MIFENIVIVSLSFLLSLLLVLLILKISRSRSWYDRIDERKIHSGDVPRLGGVGFSLAFIIVVIVMSLLGASWGGYGPRFLLVIAAMLIVLSTGIADDFRPLRPGIKLAIQIFAAFLVVLPGFTFHRKFFFDINSFGELQWWIRYPLTMLWLVGMTNALNFNDGVDGLCGGISAWAALSYGFIFIAFSGNSTAALLCFCLAAVLIGFLVFNLPLPSAKIFMGDGGAYFLGFILAVLPLLNQGMEAPSIPIPYTAALLLIPILDVTSAVWRRTRDGHPWDQPDRGHIQHKLMNLGLDAAGIDGALWSLQILLGVLVYLAIRIPGYQSLFLLGAAYLAGAGFFIAVHFLNRAVNRKGGNPFGYPQGSKQGKS